MLSKANIGVEAGADGCTTLGNLMDVFKRLNDSLVAIAQLVHVGRELLTEGQWSRILSVGAADFDDVLIILTLKLEGIGQGGQLRQKTLVDLEDGSDVHH